MGGICRSAAMLDMAEWDTGAAGVDRVGCGSCGAFVDMGVLWTCTGMLMLWACIAVAVAAALGIAAGCGMLPMGPMPGTDGCMLTAGC